MSWDLVLGYLFVGGLLAAMTWALFRMRPRLPYLVAAGALMGIELVLRLLSPILFPRHVWRGLTYEVNPAVPGAEDLVWPNKVLIFLLTALALWISFRPQRRRRLVGVGTALVVAGGWPNILEPLMRRQTTDYLAMGPIVLNLADICLVLGLPLLLVGVVWGEIQSHRAVPPDEGTERAEGQEA